MAIVPLWVVTMVTPVTSHLVLLGGYYGNCSTVGGYYGNGSTRWLLWPWFHWVVTMVMVPLGGYYGNGSTRWLI